MALARGTRIGPYEVAEQIGAGGMGEVYRATDTHLARHVAIKVLPDAVASDAERLARFEREARTLASLNHPNIAAIYGLEKSNRTMALVMELVEGPTLADRIAEGPLYLHEALRVAGQIADAIDAAHETNIVHRDLKPANIKLRADGTVKVLDFGLAKALSHPASGGDQAELATALTREQEVLGTPSYMSPEQTRGLIVDRRTDVWAFGCVLFEMLTGRRAFDGATTPDVMATVLGSEPDWTLLPLATPPSVRRLLKRCLEKDVKRRQRDIADAGADLADPDADVSPGKRFTRDRLLPIRLSRRVVLAGFGMATLVLAVVLVRGLGLWPDARASVVPTLAQVEQDMRDGEWEAAFAGARAYEKANQGREAVSELWPRLSWLTSVRSEPAGATVYRRPYKGSEDNWEALGKTPLENVRIPYGLSVLRLELEGHRSTVRLVGSSLTMTQTSRLPPQTFTLDTEQTLPDGMVRVPGWSEAVAGRPARFGDFFLGRYEVTNKEFKRFVDGGGYGRRELWEHPFVVDGKTLSWEDAMRRFVDKTGRPGPSDWEGSAYPDGEDDHPVGGVSWYEAAAYARSVGRELPSAYHWNRALAPHDAAWWLPASNLNGQRSVRVGTTTGITRWGAHDMAGNVREWVINPTGDQRLILGGSWTDRNDYIPFGNPSQPPMGRSATNGFRVAILRDEPDVAALTRLPVPERYVPNVTRLHPVSDETFAAYRNWYTYDSAAPLNAAIEDTKRTGNWIRERIVFDAPHENERMALYLYLPTDASPPYQTVLYWPAATARFVNSIEDYTLHLDYVVKNGRAVAFPVFRGTLERGGGAQAPDPPPGPALRDLVVRFVREARRSIDYLETRADLDHRKLGYYGHSWGGIAGPHLLAVDDRLKAAVLVTAGVGQEDWSAVPEADIMTFAPRVKVPVLMLNGEFDPFFPVETHARPLFNLLKIGDKKQVIAPGGHFVPQATLIRETLAWLDKYLGPTH